MGGKKVPRYLHLPYQVLWFEPDDMVMVILFLTLALIFGYFFWILLFAGPYIYGKLKKKYPRGFFKHLLYFLGIVNFKRYPNFFEKEFNE